MSSTNTNATPGLKARLQFRAHDKFTSSFEIRTTVVYRLSDGELSSQNMSFYLGSPNVSAFKLRQVVLPGMEDTQTSDLGE